MTFYMIVRQRSENASLQYFPEGFSNLAKAVKTVEQNARELGATSVHWDYDIDEAFATTDTNVHYHVQKHE